MTLERPNLRRPFTSASLKILLAVLPLLLAALILGAFLLRAYLEQTLNSHLRFSTQNELTMVEQAVEHAFLANDLNSVQKIVADLSHHDQVQAIRILDKQGRILASSAPDEVGIQLDLNSPTCQSCHSLSGPLPAFSEPLVDPGGRPQIVTAKSLDNQIACRSCHEGGAGTLGLILVDRDPVPIKAELAGLTWGIFGGAGLLFLLLASGLLLSLRRQVDEPLQTLAARSDAYDIAARRIETLETDLEQKTVQLEAQRRNFNATIALAESIDVTLTTEKVLQFAMSRVLEVTGFYSIAMRVFEPEQKQFRLVAQSGMSSQMVADLHIIPQEIGFTGDVFRTHRAAYTTDLPRDPRLESSSPAQEGFCSLISVPFLSGDRLMGTMELASKQCHAFTEEEVRWLELMGRSIGTVLHQIETSKQLQSLAVLHERSRIAQEIHDGLAQLVGTIRLWAEQGQLSLQENDLAGAAAGLQKIESSARDAYAGLREEILGLRETPLPGQGVLPVIREFLSRYRRQWGIDARIINQEDLPAGGLSPAAEVQLLRIIQEVLANVRRHANASQVAVLVQAEAGWLRFDIQDNGQGFDPSQVPDEKVGLRILRERAASVGGQVSVAASPGEGTHVTVRLPLQSAAGQGWRAVLEDEGVEASK